jgi:hypothetical protein
MITKSFVALFIICILLFDESQSIKSIWGKKRNVRIFENGDTDLSKLFSNIQYAINNDNDKTIENNNQLHYKNPHRQEVKEKNKSKPKSKELEEVFMLSEEEFFKLNKKKIIQIIQLYNKLIEQLISSQDLFTFLDIQLIQEFIQNTPILKIDENLKKSFNNPKELQNHLIEYLKDIIKHKAFFVNSFNDYKQLNTVLLHIPVYLRPIVKSIIICDLNDIMVQLDKIPSISKLQKEIFISIFSGDISIDSYTDLINLMFINQNNGDSTNMDPNRFEKGIYIRLFY